MTEKYQGYTVPYYIGSLAKLAHLYNKEAYEMVSCKELGVKCGSSLQCKNCILGWIGGLHTEQERLDAFYCYLKHWHRYGGVLREDKKPAGYKDKKARLSQKGESSSHLACDYCQHKDVPILESPCYECVMATGFPMFKWALDKVAVSCSDCIHGKDPAGSVCCGLCGTDSHVNFEHKDSVVTESDVPSLIHKVCGELEALLTEKNRKYGNAAIDPIHIFSKAEPLAQIDVRIDDKLNRIKNRQNDEDEDVYKDLTGYLILREVAKRYHKEK